MTKNIIIILLISCWTRVLPCTCISPTPEQAIRQFPVVFIGKLVSVSVDSNLLVPTEFGLQRLKFWTFDVVRYAKGLEPRHSRVSIISGGTNCDYGFDYYKNGTEFIIYANRLNQFGHLHLLTTNQCSQTKLTSEINDKFELAYYNDGSSWKSPEPLDPRYISSGPVYQPGSGEAGQSWLIPLLILINIGFTCFILFRRN